MSGVLVDSNIIIDVAKVGSVWFDWSQRALRDATNRFGSAIINQIIYAELAAGYEDRGELERLVAEGGYRREELPWEAGHKAGRCFVDYRRRGGARTSPLPDFYIGAHAEVCGYHLLTRDARRYRGYFPTLELICPPEA